MAKIPILYRDWPISLNKKMGKLFGLHRRDFNDIHCSAKNDALFVDPI